MEKKIVIFLLILCCIFSIMYDIDLKGMIYKQNNTIADNTIVDTSNELTQDDIDWMWVGCTHAYVQLLAFDENTTTYDNNTSIEHYQRFRDDIKLAQDDNYFFEVSPKFQHVQEEWQLSLIAIDNCINATMKMVTMDNGLVPKNITEYNTTRKYANEQYELARSHDNNFTAEISTLIFQSD